MRKIKFVLTDGRHITINDDGCVVDTDVPKESFNEAYYSTPVAFVAIFKE